MLISKVPLGLYIAFTVHNKESDTSSPAAGPQMRNTFLNLIDFYLIKASSIDTIWKIKKLTNTKLLKAQKNIILSYRKQTNKQAKQTTNPNPNPKQAPNHSSELLGLFNAMDFTFIAFLILVS